MSRLKFVVVLLALSLSANLFAGSTPTVAAPVADDQFIGEDFSITLDFDNTASAPGNVGYGPFVDLFLDATGIDGTGAAVDDGVTFLSATYLGIPLTSTTLTFNSSGNANHPYAVQASGAAVVVNGPSFGYEAGDSLVVLQLPFGSFVPDQPVAKIVVNLRMSNQADLNGALNYSTRGGFQYGNDELKNPASDPSVLGAISNSSFNPILMKLTKTYNGPESETATGPNFMRRYTINVDIANGQSLSSFRISDILPNNLQYTQTIAVRDSGVAAAFTTTSQPDGLPLPITPGGTLTVQFTNPVLGTTAGNDAELEYEFFIPLDDTTPNPVLNASTGNDATSVDDASARGNWTPVDTRDPAILAVSDTTNADHTLEDKSIAIQKVVANVIDTGIAGASPGDTLEYALTFQVSDYFAFQNVVVDDLFSDGQVLTGTPTLSVTEHGSTTTGNFNVANFTLTTNVPNPPEAPGTNGGDRIVFRVSSELTARGGTFLDGRMVGGAIPNTGTGGPVPPNYFPFPFGATTGTITFRTVIQENYGFDFPSTDASVDQNDVLGNSVTITGDLLNVSDLTANGNNEADTSSDSAQVPNGTLAKSIYAINGVVGPFANQTDVSPGDVVTYRLEYSHPTSDFENFVLSDYLPLPIYDATELTTVDSGMTPPPGGTVRINTTAGTGDTFRLLAGAPSPTLSTSADANSFTLTYGTYDNVGSVASKMDLFVSVTVEADPFADGLFMTNQLHRDGTTTQLGSIAQDAIIQINLRQPVLQVRKGVVATDNPNGVFSPATVGPVTFSAPGTAGYRGSGTIHSTNMAATPIDSNLTGVDNNDLVTFCITIENIGASKRGAYDIRLRDTLPAGFVVPGGAPGVNLTVTDGTGAAMAFTTIGTGLFDAAGGIELTDPGPTAAQADQTDAGALDEFDATDGRNILVVTYDLQALGAFGTITNTATLTNYAGLEGGADHEDAGYSPRPIDIATVGIPAPAKTIVTTSEAHTTGTNVAIGEIVRYRFQIVVPEGNGVFTNLQLQDLLPSRLRFLNDGTATLALISDQNPINSTEPGGSTLGLSLDAATGPAAFGQPVATPLWVSGDETTVAGITPTFILPDNSIGSSNSVTANVDTYNSGTDPYFKIGDITNTDNDSNQEFLVLEFNALILNDAGNQNGNTRSNSYRIYSAGALQVTSPSVSVRIREPIINNVNKGVVSFTGATTTYQVTYSNTGIVNAYEVLLTDNLPAANLTLITPIVSKVTTGAGTFTDTSSGNNVNVSLSLLEPGESVTVTYTATLVTGATITNTANVVYSSLPGAGTAVNPTGSSTPGASGAADGERNGSGGVNDHNDSDSELIGSMGDLVWADLDNDGTQDVGEPGLPNVTVTVLWAGANGTFGNADDVSINRVTDANGNYLASGLPAGNYRVSVNTGNLPTILNTPTFDLDGTGTASTADTTLTAGQNRTNADFGYRGPGRIGDIVFNDINNNGTADSGEGLTGVQVTLVGDIDGDGTDETVIRTTDADGNYDFPGLRVTVAGVPYSVTVNTGTVPTGLLNTVDPDGGNDSTSSLTLTSGVPTNLAQDFGYRGNGQIGDTIFLDVDNDGVPDSDEGIANVTVSLTGDIDGDTVNETVTASTNAAGVYLFSGLRTTAGGVPFTITVSTGTLPTGLSNTTDPNGGNDNTSISTLTNAAQSDLTQDFGYRGSGSVGDTIFLDADNDGLADTGEGISNVTVTLSGDHDGDTVSEVLTTVTDASGNYSFTGLTTTVGGIAYTVTVNTGTLPAGMNNTVDPNGGNDSTSITTRTNAAPNDLTQDFGYRSIGSVGDTIFLDVDNDGVPDAGEGISGVTVTLVGDFDADLANETITAVTDANGVYLFSGLYVTVAGVPYTVTVNTGTLPTGLPNTVDPNGGNDSTSNVSLTNAVPGNLAQDFGYRGLGSVGDTIFLDVDNDGVADAGEGITGVTVTLTGDHDGDASSEVLTTTTDANGAYSFTGLATTVAGVPYTVTVNTGTLPGGLTNSVDPNGGNDSTSITTRTNAAPTDVTQDFGYRGTGSIGDTIFLDVDNDGVADSGEGISGVTVTLVGDIDADLANETLTAVTDASGNYLFSGLRTTVVGVPYTITVSPGTLPSGVSNTTDPDGGLDNTSAVTLTNGAPNNLAQDFGYRSAGTIGDTVFLDVDNDGIFDAGEGIAGVTVTLTGDHDGDTVNEVLTTTTNATGGYTFTGLVTNDGGGGGIAYTVAVTTASLPAILTNSVDPDGGGNSTSNLTLTDAAQTNLLQDFGYIGNASIGDFVWNDVNGDGVQDVGEPGLPGITVSVTWAGPDNTLGNADDITFPSVATNGSGIYTVANLPAAAPSSNYRVAVTAGVPANLTATFDLDGSNDQTADTTLAPAQNRVDADFGYQGNTTVGDFVWNDRNGDGVQDANEPGIPGVTLTLIWGGPDNNLGTAGDNVTFTRVTDAAGAYSFSGIPTIAGGSNYRIAVTAGVPANMTNTFDPDGGNDQTADLALTNGQILLTQDFGYRGTGSLGDFVWNDQNGDGVQDAGEPGIPTVTLTVIWAGPDNTLANADDVSYTAVTDASGNYILSGLPIIAAGSNYRVTTTAGVPANMTPTFDLDGIGTANTADTSLTIAAPTRNDVDFGYLGNSSLGDRVFYDLNGDGVQDPGDQGISNVTVDMLWAGPNGTFGNADDVTYTSQTTDLAGDYAFTGLPVGNYRVSVQTGTLPSGMNATFDLDGGNDSTADPSLVTAQNRTDVDFGYTGTGSIGDFVWNDQNNDTVQDAGEPGLPTVSVNMTWYGNDNTFGTGDDVAFPVLVTDAAGAYLFTRLPAGSYRVDPDQGTVPANLTLSTGNDPVDLTITAGENLLTADFGYFGDSSLGDFVWNDMNGDGVQDPGEPGIPQVDLNLTWAGPNGTLGDADDVVYLMATTATNGQYLFQGLPEGLFQVDVVEATLPPNLTLTTGNEPNNAVLPAATNKLDVDFGYVGTSSIGDFVWYDMNADTNQGATEPGLQNIRLNMTYAGLDGNFGNADDITYTTLTNAVGIYAFVGLPTGSFRVDLDDTTLPTDFTVTNPPNPKAVTLPVSTVIVTVDFGATDCAPPIIVSAPVPNPNPATAGVATTFTISATDPRGRPLTFTWMFGDGSTGTGTTVPHVYVSPGTYSVTVVVANDCGLFTPATLMVEVVVPSCDPTAPVVGLPPSVSGSWSATDLTVQFTGSATDPEDGALSTLNWNFGDGTYGDGLTPVHTYATPGMYTVTATGTDSDGNCRHEMLVVAVTVSTSTFSVQNASNPRICMRSSINFRRSNKDKLLFFMDLELNDGLKMAGQEVRIDVAGYTFTGTLDAKARFKSKDLSVSVTRKGPMTRIMFRARNQDLKRMSGVTNATIKSEIIKTGFMGIMIGNSVAYLGESDLLYRAKINKVGKLRDH